MKRISALLLITVIIISGCVKAGDNDPSLSCDEVVIIPGKYYESAIPTDEVMKSGAILPEPCSSEPASAKPDIEKFELPLVLVDNVVPTAEPTPAPTAAATAQPSDTESFYTVKPGQFTDEEIYLVARFITCEARYAGDEGQRSVASVVLNRVLNSSNQFPDTVTGVLLQRNQFVRKDKLLRTEPTRKALKNARYVFKEHGSTLPKKVFFYKAEYLGTSWEDYMEYYKTIEGNCFFYGKYYF